MPSIDGRVEPAPPGVHGFDTNTVLTQDTADAFRQQGFQFCLRYLSRSTPGAGGDLSRTEAEAILAGGLALMAVQHVLKRGWVPSQSLGEQYGAAAVSNGQAAGLPPGITLWLDLEGIRSGVQDQDVIAYCNSWFDAVAAVGYQPGVYVGSECVLTGEQLFWRLRTTHYWRSGSQVPEIPQRGYQLIQRITSGPDLVNQIEVDRDLTVTDDLGGTVTWLCPDEPSRSVVQSRSIAPSSVRRPRARTRVTAKQRGARRG
jgi:hypothetical protein